MTAPAGMTHAELLAYVVDLEHTVRTQRATLDDLYHERDVAVRQHREIWTEAGDALDNVCMARLHLDEPLAPLDIEKARSALATAERQLRRATGRTCA